MVKLIKYDTANICIVNHGKNTCRNTCRKSEREPNRQREKQKSVDLFHAIWIESKIEIKVNQDEPQSSQITICQGRWCETASEFLESYHSTPNERMWTTPSPPSYLRHVAQSLPWCCQHFPAVQMRARCGWPFQRTSLAITQLSLGRNIGKCILHALPSKSLRFCLHEEFVNPSQHNPSWSRQHSATSCDCCDQRL